MKRIGSTPLKLVMVLGLLAVDRLALSASTSGRWVQASSGGLWSNPANWLSGVVAEGSGATADFSTINITADNTVHLDAPHTLTALIFGDTDISTPGGWLLDDNGNAANTLTLAGTNPSITVSALGAGKSAVIKAGIAGTVGCNVTGPGVLALRGTNNYTGVTVVNGGVLDVSALSGANGISLTSGGIVFTNKGVLQGNGTFTRNFSGSATAATGQISGQTGGFAAKGGPLSINFGGALATITLSSGSYKFGNAFVFGSPTADNVVTVRNPIDLGLNGANRLFTVNSGLGGDAAVLAGNINNNSGTLGGITKTGTGTLILSGLCTYTGGTMLNAGTLSIGAYANLPTSGTLTFNGGTLQITGIAITDLNRYTVNWSTFNGGVDVNNGFNTMMITNAIGGSGSLSKAGAGTLVLANPNNSFTGGTVVNSGTLKAVADGTLGSGDVTVTNGATLELDTPAAMSSAAGLVLLGNSNLVNLHFSGIQTINTLAIDGTNCAVGIWGALGSGAANESAAFTGTGLLAVSAVNGFWNVDASGNWSVATNWAADTIASGTGSTAYFTNVVTAGRFITNAAAQTIGNLAFGCYNGSTWTLAGSQMLTLDNAGDVPVVNCWPVSGSASSCRISAPLSGNAGLLKKGTGSLWLNSNNPSLSGSLIVAGGRVYNQAAAGLGSLSVIVSNGCYLDFWVGGTFNQNFTLNGLGAAQEGTARSALQADSVTSGTAGSFTINGTVTLNATSDIGGSSPDQTMTLNGLVTGPGGLVKNGFSNGGGTLVLANTNNDYSGGTMVNRGSLRAAANGTLGSGDVIVSNGAGLELDAPATMSSGANLVLQGVTAGMVNLNFSGTQTANRLSTNGTDCATGTWGAIGSGAQHESAIFTGTGLLNFVGPTTYATWCMIWIDHTAGWWNPTNYHGVSNFMGLYPSIDWANTNYVISSLNFIQAAGVNTVICDLSNGWGWLNSRVQYIQSLMVSNGMKLCVALGNTPDVPTFESRCKDVWNLFAGPSAPYQSTYQFKDQKPVIVCYDVLSKFNAEVASTGPYRQRFTLVWGAGESGANYKDNWGWQLIPSVGPSPSADSVYVTPSVKWASHAVSLDLWRKSQAWLDYSFKVAKDSNPVFTIVSSFDDVSECNGWAPCDTSNANLIGTQMRDITGAVNLTNYYNRVREWILGTPSAVPGGSIYDGCYVVTNLNSGKSLNMPNSVGTNLGCAGLQLIQSTPGSSLDNYFMFYHLGSNVYRIYSLNSGLALASTNNNNGTRITQQWDNTQLNQRWMLVPTNGSYYLQNFGNGKVMDVGSTNGAPVVQNPFTGGLASQQWNLGLVARIGPLAPPELSVQQAGSSMLLSWPADYANWILQKQSGNGLSLNPQAWMDVMEATTNSYRELMTNATTFYRLKSP
jgi:autotransporter-associated beta strand protein